MTTKLVLVMIISAAALMVPAQAQFDFGCFMKAGQAFMACTGKCKMDFACLERCGSDSFQAMSKCGKMPAPPASSTKMAEGPAQFNAIAMLASSSEHFVRIEGSLRFVQSFDSDSPKTYIQGRITGLAPGRMNGLHIHYNTSCTDRDDQNHDGASYLGLGNVAADESGVAEFSIAESSLTLDGGPGSVVGHALVVHPQPDHHMGILRGTGNEEYGTEITGEYCPAAVLACGIIQFAKNMAD